MPVLSCLRAAAARRLPSVRARYLADAIKIVRFDASGIDPLAGGYELVLSTCWPFDAPTPGPERYLLHATMIGPVSCQSQSRTPGRILRLPGYHAPGEGRYPPNACCHPRQVSIKRASTKKSKKE